jgi:F-type H+-transporting ATPase subunit epsilon
MAFQCVVVTPEAQVMDESVTQVILPGHDGLLGIMTDRAPMVTKLGTGPLRIDRAGGARSYFFVDGGIAQMKDNKLTILTDTATPAKEIDAESARAEYAEAVARRAVDDKAVADRDHLMERARSKQEVAKMG